MQRCNNTTLVFLAHMCWRETRRICRIRMRQIGLLVRWAGRRPRRCFKVKLRGHSWSVRAANRDATRALLCEYHILKSSIWRTDQLWDDYCAWRNPMALIYVIFFFFFCLLQREWRSEALYDLQHTTRIRLCWALRRPLLTERPCPALSPALLSATQWRPGCSAVASSTRQSRSHAFSTRRGTQTLTDSKTHSGASACRSRNVIQRKETKGTCLLYPAGMTASRCNV